MNRVARLVSFAALAVSVCGTAEAQDRRVKIMNSANQPIVELYVQRFGSRLWTPDILNEETLIPGASRTVDFDNKHGACRFRVRAVFATGAEQLADLDTCEVGVLNYRELTRP